MKMLKYILSVWLLLVATAVSAHGEEGANEAEGEKFNPKEVIFEHLGACLQFCPVAGWR